MEQMFHLMTVWFGNDGTYSAISIELARWSIYVIPLCSVCFEIDILDNILLLHYFAILVEHIVYIYSICGAIESGGSCYNVKQMPYTSASRDARLARRHRRRKPPFYKRRKNAILLLHLSPLKQREHNLFDIIDRGAYWKHLHTAGDRIGNSFTSLCELNPDVMMLFGSDWKLDIGLAKKMKTDEFLLYLGNDVAMDLTKITDSGSIFRF